MSKLRVLDTYKLMQGIEKYVVSGAVAGLTGVQWHNDDGAFTDGNTIHLPRPNAKMTDEELLLWRYKAEHELGHEDAINSMPHWKEVMKEKKQDKRYKEDGLLWWIANLISDHVQEHNRVGEMVGRDEVLLEGRKAFLDKMVFPELVGKKLKDDELRGAGLFLWDTRARTGWNSKIVPPSLDKAAGELADKIAKEGGVVLTALKNEQEVFDAAVKIRKLFPDVPNDNNFMNAKPKQGDGNGEGKKGKEGKGEANHKTAKAIPFMPSGNHSEQLEKRPTYSYSNAGDVYAPRIPVSLANSSRGGRNSGSSAHKSAVESLMRRTNLPAKVRAFLMAMKRESWTTGYRSGKLDTNRLSDVLRGKEDLFRRKEPIRLVDSAVYLLVDSSGSMSGAPFESACASALMLAEALQGIQVSVEIAGFTEFSSDNKGLVHDTWLSFGQRFVKENVLQKMSIMRGNLSNNADGENILFAYNRLKNQKQTRKILIVLSDGEPAASGPPGATMDIGKFTKQVCEQIEKDKDVLLIGLGMSGYSPKRFYKNAYSVPHGQPLEPVLLGVVRDGVLK